LSILIDCLTIKTPTIGGLHDYFGLIRSSHLLDIDVERSKSKHRSNVFFDKNLIIVLQFLYRVINV